MLVRCVDYIPHVLTHLESVQRSHRLENIRWWTRTRLKEDPPTQPNPTQPNPASPLSSLQCLFTTTMTTTKQQHNMNEGPKTIHRLHATQSCFKCKKETQHVSITLAAGIQRTHTRQTRNNNKNYRCYAACGMKRRSNTNIKNKNTLQETNLINY